MKKLKLLGTTILAASLVLAGCSQAVDEVIPGLENPGIETQTPTDGTKTPDSSAGAEDNAAEEDKSDAGDNAGDKEDDKKEDNNDGKGAGGDDSNTGDTGSEADLAAYVYHKSIIAGMADSWGSGTGVTVADGKATLVSGNLWGAGGVCGVSTVELGEIADYTYIVFTVDASDYTISEALTDLSKNTGVNVKIPEVIARPAKWFTKNGKTTYYIATSEFSNASTATSIALIIGGEGTLVVDEFYLAATEEPVEKVIEYANTTVYESGVTLTQTHWWGDWTCDVVDGNLVSTGGENGCFGLGGFTPVPFKEGAKLEVTYKSNAAWAVKPVAPEVESMLEASAEFTTVTVDLGSASNLTGVGIVHKSADSEVTISSIKVVDNE